MNNRHKNIVRLKQNQEDPFDLFGHGIQSYFFMIKNLICLFFILSILSGPIMVSYAMGQTYNNQGDIPMLSMVLGVISLGNLGGASTICLHQFVAIDQP